MNPGHDASPTTRSATKWVVVGIAVVAVFGAAGLLGMWLGSSRTAEPVAAVTPAPAPASVPAVDRPAPTIEASRDATPRPKKKVEPAAPPPEPATPTAGELHIDSDVPGAMVFLDSEVHRQCAGHRDRRRTGYAPAECDGRGVRGLLGAD